MTATNTYKPTKIMWKRANDLAETAGIRPNDARMFLAQYKTEELTSYLDGEHDWTDEFGQKVLRAVKSWMSGKTPRLLPTKAKTRTKTRRTKTKRVSRDKTKRGKASRKLEKAETVDTTNGNLDSDMLLEIVGLEKRHGKTELREGISFLDMLRG